MKIKASRSKFLKIALGGILTAVVTTGCSQELAANQYEAPSAEGAGLATTAKTLSNLSAQRTTLKPVDLTGANREIKNSDTWKICSQNIEPGAAVDYVTEIEVGVVRASETCPESGFQENVAADVETGISTEAPPPAEGWSFPTEVRDQPLDKILEQVDQNQEGQRANFTAIDIDSASPVAFNSRYKVCFTSPGNITTVDPDSNLIIGLFVTEKGKQCITEEQFNNQ